VVLAISPDDHHFRIVDYPRTTTLGHVARTSRPTAAQLLGDLELIEMALHPVYRAVALLLFLAPALVAAILGSYQRGRDVNEPCLLHAACYSGLAEQTSEPAHT
jgi:hypothetical protein